MTLSKVFLPHQLLNLHNFFGSGSNDHTTKFWCRNRPGDTARDKFNVGHNQG